MSIPKISVFETISAYLGMKKVCTRWVPELLTSLQCVNRIDCCEELLENWNQDSTGFFGRIVTRDETWIHHYDSLNQQEAKIWKKSGEKTSTWPWVARSVGKIVITVFWDCKGVLLVNFLSRGTIINGPYYASFLHRLRSSIREKCHKKLTRSVLLLQDNAPVHKSNMTRAAIQYTGFTELNCPAYYLDIAFSDYHLFSNLKTFLCGRNFESNNDRKSLFDNLDSDFFFSRHRKFMWLMNSCDC